MENTEENREKLALLVVDSMDMDDLKDFARSVLVAQYFGDYALFADDWDDMYGKDS